MEIKKLHLGVYGVAIVDRRILLVRKSRGAYLNKLDLPGGRIEHGEDIELALTREFSEEVGAQISSMSHLANRSVVVKYQEPSEGEILLHHIGLLYSVQLSQETGIVTDVNFEDVSGAGWWEIDRLTEGELSPFAFYAVRRGCSK